MRLINFLFTLRFFKTHNASLFQRIHDTMNNGYLAIVLHAHLPFIRHPEHETFLEEDWLYEAITECYLPLLQVLERLDVDNVEHRLTVSLSPTLLFMLSDPLLQKRYCSRLETLKRLARNEIKRTADEPAFNRLARHYHDLFSTAQELFIHKYDRDLVAAFGHFQEKGQLEIITSCATHAYLPLMDKNATAMRAQIETGIRCYEKKFHRLPAGIWLPECGYDDDVDAVLADTPLRYCFLESHGILNAAPRPRYGVFAPVCCPGGIAAFGRDPESSKQVWSAHGGYPGDPDYREFYRDIGYDLDHEYVKPFLHSDGSRVHTGIKYYRITGSEDKQPYDPDNARQKAAVQAEHFISCREKQITDLAGLLDRKPLIVAPFDAELFGHWWYEGPQWLEYTLRAAADNPAVRLITPFEYLEEYPDLQPVTPSPSSWGWQGYSETWLNDRNDWIYPHLHRAAELMTELARVIPRAHGPTLRALNQAARELLLAQSSDWPFIMTTGSSPEYASTRIQTHLDTFLHLRDAILDDCIDIQRLKKFENDNNIFPDIDYRIYL